MALKARRVVEPGASRDRVERLVEHRPQTQALAQKGHAADDGGDAGAGNHQRQAELDAEQSRREGTGGTEAREQRHSERALDPEHSARAAVVLGGHFDPASRPDTPVYLEVPVAPPLVHTHEVVAGGESLSEAVQN